MSASHARRGPIVHHVISGQLEYSADVADLVATLRRQTTASLFVCGGAANMKARTNDRLVTLFDALTRLSDRGVRFLAADGGTQSGVMAATGLARQRASGAFPLIGVAPAAEILPAHGGGETLVDPYHSHIIAVHHPRWTPQASRPALEPRSFWGAELDVMRDLFGRLASGRPSAVLVANGGLLALDEIRMHLDAGRRTILIAGSGRAADAAIAVLGERQPDDEETRALAEAMRKRQTLSAPELCDVFQLDEGPEALSTLLAHLLHDK